MDGSFAVATGIEHSAANMLLCEVTSMDSMAR